MKIKLVSILLAALAFSAAAIDPESRQRFAVWDAPPEIVEGYYLYWRPTNGAFSDSFRRALSNATILDLKQLNLPPGIWVLAVSATNSAGESGLSNETWWTNAPPGNPGNPDGSYTLSAPAYDAVGNVGSSAAVTVAVQNVQPDTQAPTVQVSAPADSSTVTVSNTPPPDTTAPTVQVTSPGEGATVSGIVRVGVAASDDVGVTRIELYRNGFLLGSSATFIEWYLGGAMGEGATVSGIVRVGVAASDDVGVMRIELYRNGFLLGSSATFIEWLGGAMLGVSQTASANFLWDTTQSANGSHILEARAYDAAGNKCVSSIVTVKK